MTNHIRPIVLLYHGIPRRGSARSIDAMAFEEQILFLKRHCTFIHADEYTGLRGELRRPAVLLTFDDGFRNNIDVAAPILQKHNVPATFFVSSRHSSPGRYLWFTYLKMLCQFPGDRLVLNGEVIPLGGKRTRTVAAIRERLLSLRPHPAAMYDAIATMPPLEDFVPGDVIVDECEGMSARQVAELSAEPLFTIGGHTVDHPYLTFCDAAEVARQVNENKTWIEQATGRKCNVFAYPGGLFDARVLKHCRSTFEMVFAVEWSTISDKQFAIQRVGVHSQSLARLGIKLWLGHWIPYKHMEPIRKVVHAVAPA